MKAQLKFETDKNLDGVDIIEVTTSDDNSPDRTAQYRMTRSMLKPRRIDVEDNTPAARRRGTAGVWIQMYTDTEMYEDAAHIVLTKTQALQLVKDILANIEIS